MKYSEDLVDVGRETLAVWRERAGQEAEKAIAEGIFQPSLESVVPGDLSEEDIEAVVIYQLPSGGWHCDILFGGRDGAVSNSIGTPAAQPSGSKRDAGKAGFTLLIGMLAIFRIRGKTQAARK